MGIDDLVRGALGGSGGSSDMLGQVTRLIDRAGGVEGVVSKLQASGLGDRVGSWVGTGQNQAVSGDELRGALGDDTLRDAGIDPDSSAGGLAEMLPKVIDGLTPDGSIPGAEALQGLLGKLGR